MWRFKLTKAGEDDPTEAAEFWASVDPYLGNVPWSERIADAVAAMKPSSVLEFGANAGRNLAAIRERLPDARLIGIDVNTAGVEAGRRRWEDLDLRVGDESAIEGLDVDVAFTVSVINHLPHPEVAMRKLRYAAPYLILWEPWLGEEGSLAGSEHPETSEKRPSTPYTYSWNYERLADQAGLRILRVEKVEMETRLGPHYRMFHLTR